MIHVNLKINFRWFLRLICWVRHGHPWQPVIAGTAWDVGYRYCRRCGAGWRHQGRKVCHFSFQHRWKDVGEPSLHKTKGSWVPYRQVQRCDRCRKRRVVDYGTHEHVAAF